MRFGEFNVGLDHVGKFVHDPHPRTASGREHAILDAFVRESEFGKADD
jgi:hypothetical protein